MRKAIDMTGYKFNGCEVLYRVENKNGVAHWKCKCRCGKLFVSAGSSIRKGKTNSCGCYQRERVSNSRKTHGESKSRLYGIWEGMKHRCNNPSNSRYSRYGGRGIKITSEWDSSFESFAKWSYANGYNDDLTIDRKDNNGNYEPSNCRWVNYKTQSRNRNYNKLLKFQGKELCVTEWSDLTGITSGTIYSRLRRGWSIEKTLSTPVEHKYNRG